MGTSTIDDDIDTTTDYVPGWVITDHDGESVATVVRVDEDEARVVVETTDHQRFYIYGAESFAWVLAQRRAVATRLPLGTRVEEVDEDRREPRVGVIVEATAEDLAGGEECCCFNPGSSYVLVAWSYPEDPEDGVERDWESPDDLRVLPSTATVGAR